MSIPSTYVLPPANIEWQNGIVPFHPAYNDIYYPPNHGLEQGYHIFLRGNLIPERWIQSSPLMTQGSSAFTIGELGFGTGLNFLLTLQERKRHYSSPKELYYISFEKHPLSKTDLERALEPFPELAEFSRLLIDIYPEPLWGIHRLHFPTLATTLDLYFGDANELLPEGEFLCDAWYLDGFSPKEDGGLWNEELFREMSRHSHAETTLATYSSAGWVRRSLEACGWSIEKRAQTGGKRETIVGTYSSGEPKRPQPSIKQVDIIGGGMAGLNLAGALAAKGVAVTLHEREGSICTKASGNSRGVVFPYITKSPNPMSLLYLSSYLYAKRFYGDEMEVAPVVHFPSTERLEALLRAFPTLSFPSTIATPLSETEVQELLGGSALTSPALFYPAAGWIRPKRVGESILSKYQDLITLKTFHDVRDLSWCSDTVPLLANAYEASHLVRGINLSLQPVRGQIATLRASARSQALPYTLCYDGYFLPADKEGEHLIGASYDHHSTETTERWDENLKMLERLRRWLPECDLTPTDIVSTRVAFRTTTKDRLPLVGKLSSFPLSSYEKHLTHPLLFAGFGSRGLTTIPLLAEYLACLLLEHPLPIPRSLSKIIHPARFSL